MNTSWIRSFTFSCGRGIREHAETVHGLLRICLAFGFLFKTSSSRWERTAHLEWVDSTVK